MASIEILDTGCDRLNCVGGARLAVKSRGGLLVGKYCRRHATEELKIETEKERTPGSSGTSAAPLKGVTAQ